MTTWQRWRRDLSWEWRVLQAKSWFHPLCVVFFVVMLVEFVWECWSGAGVTGWVMRAQLERYGTFSVGLWVGLYFLIAVLLPFSMAVGTSKPPLDSRRKNEHGLEMVLGGIVLTLALMAGGAYWMRSQVPDLEARPVRVDVTKAQGNLSEGMAHLAGVIRNDLGVSYTASWRRGSGATAVTVSEIRSLVPVTGQEWTAGEPVRFLFAGKIEMRGLAHLPQGMLLANSLPWYLRSALERRGLKLANPYYVVYTDAYQATQGNWDAMAAICGFFAVVLGVILIVIVWQESRKKSKG